MRYIKFLSIIIIVLIINDIYGQDTIRITGTVKDFYSKRSLPYANISIKNTYIGTSANIFGKFTLEIPETFLPLELTANFIAYEDTSINITKKRNQNCSFILYPKSIDINEITVNSEKNVVFGNREYQIIDYLIHEDKILIISYKKRLSKSILIMTNLTGKTLAAIPIKGKPIQLYTDCVKKQFLVCQSIPYMIHISDTSLRLQMAFQDKFNKLLKPCVASIDKTLFYKYMGPFDLSLEYYSYNLVNNDFNLFTRINDEFQQNMFVTDFNHLLRSNGIKIMGNTNNYESLRKFRSKDLKEVFKFNMFHQAIYAPLLVNNDTIIIFDHPNSNIQNFNINGEHLKNIPIYYEQMKNWTPNIIVDEIQNKYYTTSLKNSITTLYEVDIYTGKYKEVKRISYSWIEKPLIRDNIVYFLYRRKDKNSAKFLYYEDL
ncbi:MAG: carboxypeptidase-like regulatory domain-containing protein [Salinivirgaceae bacterium]|nr:carboxypeptidase-like regulatory domain-containing protein [Salinivirgaceae bacterium]